MRLFFKPYQLPPSPCVRCAWARAVTFVVSGVISRVSSGLDQLGLCRRHMSCDNDDFSIFALISSNSFSFFMFLPYISPDRSPYVSLVLKLFLCFLVSSDFPYP